MYKIFDCKDGIVVQNEERPSNVLKVAEGILEHSETTVTVSVKEETKGVLGGTPGFSGREVRKPKIKIFNAPVLVLYVPESMEDIEQMLENETTAEENEAKDFQLHSIEGYSLNTQLEEALGRVLSKLENATIMIQPESGSVGAKNPVGRPATKKAEGTTPEASEPNVQNPGTSDPVPGNQE